MARERNFNANSDHDLDAERDDDRDADWDDDDSLEGLSKSLPKERCIVCDHDVESDFPFAMVCDYCLWGERVYKYFQYNKTLAGGSHHH